jgi:hypothetical protein
MKNNIPTAEEWLAHEDSTCRQDRMVEGPNLSFIGFKMQRKAKRRR